MLGNRKDHLRSENFEIVLFSFMAFLYSDEQIALFMEFQIVCVGLSSEALRFSRKNFESMIDTFLTYPTEQNTRHKRRVGRNEWVTEMKVRYYAVCGLQCVHHIYGA